RATRGATMIRLLVSAAVYLGANASGLIVANALLLDTSVRGSALVIAVLIITGGEVLVPPLCPQIAGQTFEALASSSARAASAVVVVAEGTQISGLCRWVVATCSVGGAARRAGLLLRAILVKRAVGRARS